MLAVDLVAAVRSIHPTSPRSYVFFETEATDWLLEKEEPARTTIVTARIPSGFFPAYGIEQTIAYDGILPLRFFRLFSNLGEDFWRKMMAPLGVKYVVHDPKNTPVHRRLLARRLRFDRDDGRLGDLGVRKGVSAGLVGR